MLSKSRGTADCCYMNFHRGGTLRAPREEESLFKSLLIVLCSVALKKALQSCFRKQRGAKSGDHLRAAWKIFVYSL